MKEYLKPYIEDEEIDIEDICTVSGGTQGGNADSNGQEFDIEDVWPSINN